MACEYGKSVDGFERQFAVSHLGPFLFTNLIMKKILAAPEPRVVNVSSDGHRLSGIRWFDPGFDEGQLYNRWRAYGQGKTANILFATALKDKLGQKGLVTVALHPGVISTNLGNHMDWSVDYATLTAIDKELGNMEGWKTAFDRKTPQQGVATHVYAAFDPSLQNHNGAYCQDGHISDPFVDTLKSYAVSSIDAERLWQMSEKMVKQQFSY
jgi:NAD(P)-dependent dehydrogenase (short-subunit alcohol dehydrogenase family)